MAERPDRKILSSLKGFIFDMDGTLLESMGLWDKLYADLFAEDGSSNCPTAPNMRCGTRRSG